MPLARAGMGGGVIGSGELVVAGGSRWSTPETKEHVARVDAYDAARDRWRRLADLPIGIDGAAGAVQAGTLYLAGGYDGTVARREVLRLERTETAGKWTRVGSLPEGRVLAAAAVLKGKVFICGGVVDPTTYEDHGSAPLFVFDPSARSASQSITARRPFPGVARVLHSLVTLRGALYLFGGAARSGTKAAGSSVVNTREVWRYSADQDRWERLRDAPTAVRGAGVVSLKDGSSALLLGGYRDDLPDGTPPGFTRAVWSFNAQTEQWQQWESSMLPVAFGVALFGVVLAGPGASPLLVAAGGEDGPRSRTPRTWRGRLNDLTAM